MDPKPKPDEERPASCLLIDVTGIRLDFPFDASLKPMEGNSDLFAINFIVFGLTNNI
jgi:hypothetical protein